MHAIVGGLIGEAAGGDFRTAALAAGANEALLNLVGKDIFPGDAHARLVAMTSQLVGITVAAGAGGSAKDQEVAGWVTQQAAIYNYLTHDQQEDLAKKIDATCKNDVECIKNELKAAKPLADQQNNFSEAEQAEYDNALGILTNASEEPCDVWLALADAHLRFRQMQLQPGLRLLPTVPQVTYRRGLFEVYPKISFLR